MAEPGKTDTNTQLTAEQLEALEALREAIRGSEKGDEEERGGLADDDRGLLRFLRARKFNVKQATTMAENNLPASLDILQ